jgi:DUF1009 family protein
MRVKGGQRLRLATSLASVGRLSGKRGSVVVKALRYKQEGRNSFDLPVPSGRTMSWGLLSLKQK